MIIAFSRVHYGLDYLGYVIASALPYVDKFVVLYTYNPSFGNYTLVPCPDGRDDLLNLAIRSAGNKLHWIEDAPLSAQTVFDRYPDADIVLELDADEIIDPKLFERIIEQRKDGKLNLFNYTVPFLHHWRSFDHVCIGGDSARLYLPHNPQSPYGTLPDAVGAIHHMGYARNVIDMRYKWETSVHKWELRQNWWNEKFLPWTPQNGPHNDVHPVSIDYWNVVPYDKVGWPDFMRIHPYFDKEVIE